MNEKLSFTLEDREGGSGAKSGPSLSPSLTLEGYSPRLVETASKIVDAPTPVSSRHMLPKLDLAVPGKAPLKVPGLDNPEPYKCSEDGPLVELLHRVARPRLLLSRSLIPSCGGDASKRKFTESGLSDVAPSGSMSYLKNEWIDVDKKPIGSSLHPSVLFCTFTNIYNELLCLDVDAEVTQAVAGLQSHSVRVFSLASEAPPSKKSISDSISSTRQFLNDPARTLVHELYDIFPKEQRQLDSLLESLESHEYSKRKYQPQSPPGMDTPTCKCELFGHTGPVYGVAQDRYGRMVLSSSSDETVRLWDTHLGQCVSKYQMSSPAWTVAFSPIDCFFAAGASNGSVAVFNTSRRSPSRIFLGHTSDVICASWSANGIILCSGSDDKTARVWDTRSAECVRVLSGSHTPLSAISFSKDGRLLACGTDSGFIYVHDIYTSRLLGIFNGHSNMVTSLDFSEDSTGLVSGSLDSSVRVWSVRDLVDRYSSVGTQAQTDSPLTPEPFSSQEVSLDQSSHLGLSQLRADRDPPSHYSLPGGSASTNVLGPMQVYRTKHTPVFLARYTSQNLIYAGGPYQS